MVTVSTRGASLPASPIRKLKPFADEAMAKGKSIYYLNIGQPDIETPVNMLNVLKKLENKVIPYGPSQGLPEYQDALIKYYNRHNINLTRDQIIVTNGGSEAILMALTVCMDPGDEVIIPEPFYANYNGFAVASGVVIKPLTTVLENNWKLPSIEEFEKQITSKTKAIMICNPNNPTGKLYGKEDLLKIAEIAKKHNLFLLSDEVYREFIYGDEKYTSLINFEGMQDRVIILDSISKRFSACGSRIGAFVSKDPAIMQAALCYAQARLCAPTIDQLMAIPSVELNECYFEETLGEYQKRRDVVVEALSDMEGVDFKTPDGAFYIIISLPVKDAEHFVKWLLVDFDINGETVMLAPANGFYSTPGLGENQVRIAFVLNEEKTKRAMNILKEGLDEYRKINM
ncbi:MAG: pyridoxal phosphate-dependent aminotransferase [Bacteriovoracaceae bacterium]|nr:pyridoxal phosphate-dependent aminotransferase [Bacteriovoracaceae bacterium]